MKNSSRYQCKGPLLKAQIQMLDQNIKEKIGGQKKTLTCDGQNNKRHKHFVAMMITVDGVVYSTRVINNTADYTEVCGGKVDRRQ